MMRLLLADRVKQQADTFLAPLLDPLRRYYDVRFVSLPPGPALAEAIGWADIVWLEWCWDHAVWATRSGVLGGRRCILRLHSIEALQTDYPARIDWSVVDRLVTVGEDIAELIRRFPNAPAAHVIPNGIDTDRFRPGDAPPDRQRIGWVGHLEPKKNPMLMLQIAHRLMRTRHGWSIHVAGAATDLRTARYLTQITNQLNLGDVVRFEGHVADMPTWYADKGVLLSTSMYESFGLNIGEAMACGAFPVVHDFPGAAGLWPPECLYADIDHAVALIRSAQTGLYRDWVMDRYGLGRQVDQVLDLLSEMVPQPADA